MKVHLRITIICGTEAVSMKETHDFLVPDYYPDFHCKMGACRHSCCEGWPVTISLKDYYRIANEECSEEMKSRIMLALKVLPHPMQEEYAEISHDYTGQCRFRMEDGRCILHAQIGEHALAPVCRLYPRGMRTEGDYECSCALSCEETLELLYKKEDPIRFIPFRILAEIPDTGERSVYFETVGREQEIRLFFISIVQDRRFPLCVRLLHLSEAIIDMQQALQNTDVDEVNRILGSGYDEVPPPKAITSEELAFGMRIAGRFLEIMDERSQSVMEYGQKALSAIGSDENAYEKYLSAKRRFENRFPKWESYMENLLVNHMFFERFPFQDRPDSLTAEKLALDAIYIMMRFTSIGCEIDDEIALIDLYHSLFRFIDHTEFDRYAGRVLEKLGCDTPQKQLDVLTL